MSISIFKKSAIALSCALLLVACSKNDTAPATDAATVAPETAPAETMPAEPVVVDNAHLHITNSTAEPSFVDVLAATYAGQTLGTVHEKGLLTPEAQACLNDTKAYHALAQKAAQSTVTPEGLQALDAFFATENGRIFHASQFEDLSKAYTNEQIEAASAEFSQILEAHSIENPAPENEDDYNALYAAMNDEFVRCNIVMPEGWNPAAVAVVPAE